MHRVRAYFVSDLIVPKKEKFKQKPTKSVDPLLKYTQCKYEKGLGIQGSLRQ